MDEKGIVVYVSDDCKESQRVINLLDRLAVPYQTKNISRTRTYLLELQGMGVYSTPAVIINETDKVLGYQAYKIKQLIKSFKDKNI